MIQSATRIQNVQEYYFSQKLAEVRKLDTPELPVINLGIGSPDLAPSPKAIDALITTSQSTGSHGYQSYKGIPALRNAIAAFSKKHYHINLDAESMILPLMGSKEGIMHIMMAFVNEGDEVLIPDPGYPTYESAARLVGASIKKYLLQEDLNWFVDIDKLRKQDLSKVKVMWVNFPNMPTGRVASADEMRALVELAVANNFLIVNDNPYSFIMNENPLSILSIKGAERVALELNSLSKSHNMAGWRIGWVAGHATYIDAVLRVKSNMDSGMFLGLQTAAVEALAHDNSWFEKLNATYRERKKIGEEILAALHCTFQPAQSGLFVWAKLPDHVANVETWVDEILYKTHVFITPGFIFGKAGDRFVRLSVCAPVEKLTEALARIRKFSSASQVIEQKSIAV